MITIHDYDTPSDQTFWLVIQGVRNSWESHNKGDSSFGDYDPEWGTYSCFTLGEADKALCTKLVNAGSDHGKFLRQLPIVIDFTAPESFLKQFDTYKVGTTRNSTSTMHTLGKNQITADMFSWEDLPQGAQNDLLDLLNGLRDDWIEAGKRKGKGQKEWKALIEALPMSFNFRSCWSANYQVLRSIYFARRHHRLDEWHTFCDWITTLPYAELITVEK